MSPLPKRLNNSWLASLEMKALAWLSARAPNWVTPDGLTSLGFAGALISAIGYWCASTSVWFLWIATIGLAINWLGDSLDGTLARFRQRERPRYGFALDQGLDAVEQLILVIGIGLSGLIRFELAMLGLALFFMLSMLALIRAIVTNTFALSTGGIGLTEWRVGFVLLNTAMFFAPPQPMELLRISTSYPNMIAIIVIAVMVGVFVWSMVALLRELAIEEPPPAAQSETLQGR